MYGRFLSWKRQSGGAEMGGMHNYFFRMTKQKFEFQHNFYLICVIMTFGEIDRKSVATKMRAPVTPERINDRAVSTKMMQLEEMFLRLETMTIVGDVGVPVVEVPGVVEAAAGGMPLVAAPVVGAPEAVVAAAAGGMPPVAPPVVEAPGVVLPALAGAEPQVAVAAVAGGTPTLVAPVVEAPEAVGADP